MSGSPSNNKHALPAAACLYCAVCVSHPAVPSLSCVRDQDGPLQFSRTQDGASLAQSEDGVPALQRRFRKKAYGRESRRSTCALTHISTLGPKMK